MNAALFFVVSFTAIHYGNQADQSVFQSLRAAKAWANWLREKPTVYGHVTIWRGTPGGERVQE